MQNEEISATCLAPHDTPVEDVHEITDDTEDIPDVSHKNDVDENKTTWYFDTASNLHVTGNRAHFLTFSEVDTSLHSIRGVSSNFVSRVSGTGTVGLFTEVGFQDVDYTRL